jgi:4-amino-4-deoxy-L-arabinose transferase-like glycosyltransferase
MLADLRQRLIERHRVAAAAVLALTAVLFFARLGERSLWSEEVRWAEIPREMQRSGDYFRPTFNGRVYYDKPLGSYWLVLIAARFVGEINELAARLPSAVSGVAAVVFLMLIARRLYDGRTAVLAGAILATSFGFTGFVRTASADAETVAGVLAALWLFVRTDGRPGWWLLPFWLVMAATSLTKGLLGFALPLLIVVVYSTWTGLADDDAGRGPLGRIVARYGWVFNRVTPLAVLLAAAVYLAPFAVSLGGGTAGEGLAMVYRENVRRYFDPVNHHGEPIYAYGYIIFGLFAPWSVILPLALIRAHRRLATDRFILAFFWSLFVFFTLSASRRSYYLLPVLPAAALLVAALLTSRERERDEAPVRTRTRLVPLLGFGLAALAPIALIPSEMRPAPLDRFPPLPAPAAFAAAWMVSVAGLVIAAVRPPRIAAALVAVVFAFQCYLFVFALPAADGYRTQRPFAAAVREALYPDPAGLALYRTSDIVYYLDPPEPLPEVHDPDDLRSALDDGAVRWLIVRRRDRDALGDGWSEVVGETIQPWEGPAQAAAKLLLCRSKN